ncbi:MAG: ribonuclease III [Treponema sp.]|jgi:ribonuclease-3|nr:ribonuclease III [Treponema sp.]
MGTPKVFPADALRTGGRGLPSLDSDRRKALRVFQKNAGLKFKSLELLNAAFMHRSVSNESGYKINNERLEFLGDAVLGAVAASLLYRDLDKKPEGELAKIKSVVVSEDILSGIARVLQIDTVLLLGKGEELTGGRMKKGILADALEALIGALYLDSGYNAAFSFVSRYISPEIGRVRDRNFHQDYKSILQELSQRLFRACPAYRMVKRSGPEHDRLFWMEVTVNDRVYGPGMGRNKKSAEQEAAKMAWNALNSEI